MDNNYYKWTIPGLFFFLFDYTTVNRKHVLNKKILMTRF